MIKSKRGRKPKNKNLNDISNNQIENNIITTDISNNLPKKRGRKPKGGKIIKTTNLKNKIIQTMPNIILHLQCNMNDVKTTFNISDSYNPNVIQVENYNNEDNFFKTHYTLLSSNDNGNNNDMDNNNNTIEYSEQKMNTKINNINFDSLTNVEAYKKIKVDENKTEETNNKIKSKNIAKKLKDLTCKLHNNICDNKSACFWCTCKFNTSNIYIPKNIQNDIINVYGCFCSPECATSFLMNEHIDSSIKFERYSLINYIYGSIYNYKKNIKPAPNPYYMLDKFCGNLTIDEYRSHFTDGNLLIVANKPLSRIMPELFEENNMSTNDMRYSINKYS